MYAIIDVETTGFQNSDNRITEIALYVHDGDKVLDSFETLVDPECKIPFFIQRLTGISDEMVKGKPKFYEIAEKVHRLTEDCVFVAHNVGFDYNTIRKEYTSLGFDYRRKKLCTVRLSRKAFPGLPKYGLGHLCRYFGIANDARHRAAGDALATVQLFERIMEADQGRWIPTSLHPRSKEASLPSALDVKEVEALPRDFGIYYFKDSKGKVLYVGKANDIYARVMSHFYSKENRERRMQAEIAHVDYMLCGSELMSLLVESAEIKRLYPKYNRAGRRRSDPWCIFSYTDNKGVMHLGYGASKHVKQALARFYTITQCRSFLETLKETFELCPRYLQLQSVNGPCFHFSLKQCKGVCADQEGIENYNTRVVQAIESISQLQGNFLIVLSGRDDKETGFVLMESGQYKGYGFLPHARKKLRKDKISQYLITQDDNSDIQRILRSYLRHEENPDIIELVQPIDHVGQNTLSLF